MVMTAPEESVQTIHVFKEIEIAAPIEIAFEAVLAEIGPGSELPNGQPFPMKLEPWPGGRWYRDLGNNTGHFWGHVQVYKPPKLLELCGPLFMSYPALSHVQYRLLDEGENTRLQLTHRAMGLIPEEHRLGVNDGWDHAIQRIHAIAKQLKSKQS